MRAARILSARASAQVPSTLRDEPDAANAAQPVNARTGARTALAWGSLGFITGAFFWHAVGFWGFVSEVVLNGSAENRGVLELAQMPTPVAASGAPIPTVYLVEADRCTALALDRPTNRTQIVPCPQTGLPLRLEPSAKREDLADPAREPTLQTIGYRPQ